ncbi:MAG TPA: histidine phosphatase family protein [Nitrospiria bacterium]|nr:histidine phosphatase family protein [Nitrospiria bacterium]
MREKEQATSIVYLRHGLTDYPDNRYYCDRKEDPALNSKGLDQAERIVARLRDLPIIAAYVSPSRRAQETAAPTLKVFGLTPTIVKELRERDFGVWEGLTNEEIDQQFPDGRRMLVTNPMTYAPEGGENLINFGKRIDGFVNELIKRHKGETVLLVTHVGPIRAAVTTAIGIPITHYRRLVVANGSVTRIDYTESWPNLMTFSLVP